MAETIFEFMHDPRYSSLSEPREEADELSFDADVDPTEYGCNTCDWRGQPASRMTYLGGMAELFYCPTCQKWTELEEWNTVPADPFEFPMLETATSVADLQSIPVRKAAAAQLDLFREVA
jgi:hypothetical protein